MTKSDWEKRAEEAGQTYAFGTVKNVNELSERAVHGRMGARGGFAAGIAWARANPQPEVLALVEALEGKLGGKHTPFCGVKSDPAGYYPCDCGFEALAAFNEAKEKAGKT